MSAPVSVTLPTPPRRRAEIIGLSTGFLCFPFAFFGQSLGRILPNGPAGVVLPIVFFSTLGGVVVCLLAYVYEGTIELGIAPRVGVRAGAVAALSGGALTVLASTLHAFGIGHPPEGSLWITYLEKVFPSARAFQTLIITLLGMPPSIFFAMAGSFVTAMIRNHVPASDAKKKTISSRRWIPRNPLFASIVLLSVIGFLSPFTISLFLKPKPVAVESPPATPPPKVAIQTPPPLKWHYEKPAGFDTAEANRIFVQASSPLSAVDGSLPVALSPNEHLFASFQQGGGLTLQVHDLDTHDLVAKAVIQQQPASLAWSPDSRRIIFATAGNGRNLEVFDLETSRLYSLPQPAGNQLPEGRLIWWNSDEVLIFKNERHIFLKDGVFKATGEPLPILSLDTLRVSNATDSAKWSALSQEEQASIIRGPPRLPANTRWEMKIQPAVHGYTPFADPSGHWQRLEHLQLALDSARNAYRNAFRPAGVNVNDLVVGTSDGTKVVRVRDNQATVFYFGLRDETATHFRITMPAAPESSLAEPLTTKTLCAFICAPLTNPLNGKVVGPDRRIIKALVRFASWKDTNAELWTQEDYRPVQIGDVVTDLHTWTGGEAHSAGELGKSEWFAVIDQTFTASPPLLEDTPHLDRTWWVKTSDNGAIRVEKIELSQASRPSPPTVSTPAPSPPVPAVPPLPMVTNLPQRPPEPSFAEVRTVLNKFIFDHHAKSTRGDVDGLVSAYAEHVDHFDHGYVDRAFIRKDELDYHVGYRVTETIITAISFAPAGESKYSAAYSISFLRVHPDRRWTKGISDIQLVIEMTPSGPQIIYHRAQSRDQQKGR